MAKSDVTRHRLVPKHSKVTDKEIKAVFEKHSLELENLPKIKRDDAGIVHLDVKEGDVIKIERASPTAGTTIFYRRVVNAS
jgi:DNA-directed RNA polymerase subunit H (RpoH/RPB5)